MTVRSDRLLRAGVGLWGLALIVVGVLVCLDPVRRSVTPVFHLAAERWWARRPLYSDPRGFHYLPQFALLFAPFHALPLPLGDLLWRALSVAAVLVGCRSFARRASGEDADRWARAFGVALILSIWPCLGAIRNGQTNLAFGGLLLIAASLLARERWSAAAAVLVFLVAVKPLGLVVLLLAPWGYPKLWARLGAGLAVLAAIPFAFAPAGYVVAQYHDAVVHIASWSATNEARFADLSSLLRRIGLGPAPAAATAIRAAFGVATLALWIAAARRRPEPKRALTLALLSACYLLLFNPMTEKNTYAIAAPAMGVAAGWTFASDRAAGRRWFGWLLAGVLLSIGVLPEALHRIDPDFGLWWDPLAMTAVGAALAFRILGPAGGMSNANGDPAMPAVPSR